MKKKKTVHLRRVRERSFNKSYRASPQNFQLYFEAIFLRKLRNKISFYSFLLSFFCIGHNKILNYYRILGLPRTNSTLQIKKKISIKNFKLYKKYRKKKIKYIAVRKKNKKFKQIKLVFAKMFYNIRSPNWIRRKNVANKKKLCIYFSYRHLLKLPVRGQRTKTNAKTRKNYNII